MSFHSFRIREDTSNYWTASIYFKSPENGTYRKVPQMANGRQNRTLLEQDGGLTIYYMRPFGGNLKTTAMKPVSQEHLVSQVTSSQQCTGLSHVSW
jgi:hypothetical protein